jgi:hypothetical protein
MKSDMLYRESESSDLQARFPLAATQEETANTLRRIIVRNDGQAGQI